MFERFTKDARLAVVCAQEEARSLRHSWIGAEHLLLAVAARPGAPGTATLTRLGVTAEACREAIRSAGALDEGDAEALRSLGIDLDTVRARAESAFGPGALDRQPDGTRFGGLLRRAPRRPRHHIPFTKDAKRALEQSLRAALARKENWIGTEHVLLGVLSGGDPATVRVLDALGTDPVALRGSVLADLRPAA
ncbi:Clp protease N-terminal domain-containing protein [Streptomyces sp. I05A-00742]|uniref:Clp protease N-terminal domain-containing protein n=1 Tax=Streptomyces sp. I05A-00742 TaxID=2732853 RepID=UPI0014894EC0